MQKFYLVTQDIMVHFPLHIRLPGCQAMPSLRLLWGERKNRFDWPYQIDLWKEHLKSLVRLSVLLSIDKIRSWTGGNTLENNDLEIHCPLIKSRSAVPSPLIRVVMATGWLQGRVKEVGSP